MADGFLFLPSFYEAIIDLPDDERHAMQDALLDYWFTGAAPDLPKNLARLFTLIKPNVDASRKRRETNKANGAKGGRPPKAKKTER